MSKPEPNKWYPSREAATFLEVTEASVKKYCREGKLKAKQIGPKKAWHALGASISKLQDDWGMD